MRRSSLIRWLTVAAWLILNNGAAAGAHADGLVALMETANNLVSRGEYSAAESLLLEAFKRTEGSEPDWGRKGIVLNALGAVYSHTGDDLKAETCYRRSIEIMTTAFGANFLGADIVRINLANLYARAGQIAKAERVGIRALLNRDPADLDGVGRAKLLSALGRLEVARGRYSEALRDFQESLAIRKALDPEGLSTLEAINNVGAVLMKEGSIPEALRIMNEGLGIAERKWGSDHPVLITLLANIGSAHVAANRLATAEPFYVRAVAIGEKTLGGDHPLLGQVLSQHSVALERMHRKSEAKVVRRRANSILNASSQTSPATHTVEWADLR